jgi:hypothetical protein
MKTFLKTSTTLLLLINGVGALYGGWNLITHPDGSSLQMSPNYLQYSPFDNYFIPGIILFLVNGLFDFLVLGALLINHRYVPLLVTFQGVLLTGWIFIQVIMVRDIYFLHILLGTAGLLLILLGRRMKKGKNG